MATEQYYTGRVHTILFEDPSSAFYIAKVLLDDPSTSGDVMQLFSGNLEPVTVKGNIPGIVVREGTWFGFEARWTTHKQHGKQLQITKAPVIKGDWDDETIEKLLVSNGVGLQVTRSIRLSYPGDFATVLSDEKRLQDVPGITPLSAAHIVQRWDSIRGLFKTLAFLGDLGLSAGKLKDVWAIFKDKAEQVLSRDPWALVQVDGVSFQEADEISRRLGLPADSPGRLKGALVYSSRTSGTFGHLYLTTGHLYQAVRNELGEVTQADFAKVLLECYREGTVILDKVTRPGTTAVYEPVSYELETTSAAALQDRINTAAWGRDDRTLEYLKAFKSVGPQSEALVLEIGEDPLQWTREPDEFLWDVARTAVEERGAQSNLGLSSAQQQGVINALAAPISVLTGLPGTGKTTSLKAAVRILQDAEVEFLLVAPTGIAAKNLSARTGAPASTIHRAFAAKGENNDSRKTAYTGIQGKQTRKVTAAEPGEDWGFDQTQPHKAKVVIIDEASMMDQHLLYRLLDCTAPGCRIVFVGDYAQLPSVGPGNVLRDLIHCQRFPTIKLVDIFRQKDTSGIVFAAHSIVKGEMPDMTGKDFRLVQLGSEDQVLEAILKIATKFYDAKLNFQILSPRHAGAVGVTNLNARLRELLNPGSSSLGEVRLGDNTIREGDRIMVVRNDYRLGVYNGDVGKVNRIDQSKKEIEIKIFGEPPLYVLIQFKDAGKLLRLAYACTVHKAQGLEYDSIVMPLVTGFYHQLQRNLLYTAITRAKKQVVLVGHEEALRLAILNDKETARLTLFLDRLGGAPQTP